ncbi:hypothetical protein ACT5DM_003049 [Vibrio alginolyticus]|uniref:hypothetical protein n=1 Tax=Vibrio alginolyticus TaxID=663 RepID=UPI0012AE7866|nr:hypothetical protein [Vibrio alginolyticus]
MSVSDYLYLTLIFVVGLGFKELLRAYFKKKGSNLATKEDIGKITEKIEEVRSSFDIENEIKKTYLKERNVELLCFYDKLSEFRYEYLSVNIGNFPLDDGKALYEFQQGFHTQVVEIIKQYQRLVVFLTANSKILLIAENLTNITFEVDKVMRSKFGKVKSASIEESLAYSRQIGEKPDSKSEYYAATKRTSEANEEFLAAMKPHINEYLKGYKFYLTELNEQIVLSKCKNKG